jgi:hypothetical protein
VDHSDRAWPGDEAVNAFEGVQHDALNQIAEGQVPR